MPIYDLRWKSDGKRNLFERRTTTTTTTQQRSFVTKDRRVCVCLDTQPDFPQIVEKFRLARLAKGEEGNSE